MLTLFKNRKRLDRAPQLLALALIAPGTCATTHAQTKTETVVVTATRVPEPMANALRDITVIYADTLREAGVVDIVDALRSVPGVELSQTGPGATPSIFIRGANSNQTLILVDGQGIASSYSGLSALQHVSIDQIERIEVLRGPAASLYGADAVGGVIQIFTRRDRNFALRTGAGEWHSTHAGINAGLGNADNGVAISASQSRSRGYNAIVNPNDYSYNPDRDGYRFNSVQMNGALTLSPALKLGLSAFETRGKSQYDGDATYDDRVTSVVNNVSANIDLQGSSGWLSTLRLGSGGEKSAFDSTFPGRYQTRHDQIVWQNTLRVSPSLGLLGAAEWRRETVSGTDSLPVTVRRTGSALIAADGLLDAWRINTSVRLDDSSQYGTRTTASGSLGYRITPALRAAVNAGSSFKAPTFNDLYYPGYANPNLKPERGQSIDAALHWTSGASRLSATIYQNAVRDLIQFECDANYNCAPQNVAKARLQGLTLAGGTRLGGLLVDGSVDVGDPKNVTTNRQLARRARQHAALKVSGDLFGFATGIELVASDRRYDNAGNSRALPGYALLNVHASRVVLPGVRLGVRVENATDRDYQLAYGYATGGRRGWLTLVVER
jgi:vitamin B12 transporter